MNVIAPQHLKITRAHKEHQKRKTSAFYLLEDNHFGTSAHSLASPPRWNKRPRSVIAGSGPAEALDARARGNMTFKLADEDGHAKQSGSGLSVKSATGGLRPRRRGRAAALAASTRPQHPAPRGGGVGGGRGEGGSTGHQAHRWHRSIDAGENIFMKKKKETMEANNTTHEK